jgi:protein-disulfide isomerase
MAKQTYREPPPSSGGMMSVPSAVILTLIAFVGGLFIGHVTARRDGTAGGDEVAMADGDHEGAGGGGPTIDDDVERVRVDVTDDMPQRGPDDALVTIVMFSDFQCPFCGRVEPTLTRIREQYGDRVRIVWRNQPLPFHDNAMPAAEAALEAYAQGGDAKFWQLHDVMMEHQTALTRADLETYAQQVGLDMTRFRAALDNHTHQAAVQADSAAGTRAGANGTPSFFINGRSVVGAQPFEQFQTVIDDELHRGEAQVAHGTPRAQLYAALMRGAAATPPAAAPEGAAPPAPARPQPDPNAVYRVPVTAAQPVRGPADALVTMVVVSDFQCPFCSRVEPTVTQLIESYGRDLRVVWRNNPLPFHENAGPAAELAMEAFEQQGSDGFWRMHDTLFEHQTALARTDLEGYAQAQGLNMTAVRNALDNNTHQASITADQDLARQLGASGTPSFFINGRNLRGAQPIEQFRTVIDAARTDAQARVAAGTPRARVYDAITADGATSPVMLPGAAAPDAPPGEDPNRVYNIPVPAATASPSQGPASAPVVIQVFSDFQCPFCSRVEPTVHQFMEHYQGRVRMIWRNYPLPFHQNAMPAAEAAAEVFHQRGAAAFWAYHDALFENQSDLSRATLERLAQAVPGINMAAFTASLDNHTHQAEIQADMDAVRTAGAEIGTPSFFINGRLVQGAQPIEAFNAAIDRAIAEHH